MTAVGRLIEGILSVKYNGKWKKRLCSLEKQATFTNSLNFLVTKQGSSVCFIQDVVHAYLWSLDPNHPGTIMLVCNYKVRCISFDQFEELNNWVEVLKTYLSCNYFHADLILASKESSLYRYARKRRRQLRHLPSHKRHSTTTNPNSNPMFCASSGLRDDGYLHVTRDRICFTTSPACSRPKLLATWNFDNDELVQCCTGRAISANSGSDRANLFCLTASVTHPDAPGGHLFISDRANELCEWIETNNQTAVYQAEWRRLTSMTAALNAPFNSTTLSHSYSTAHNFGDYTSLLNTEVGSLCNEMDKMDNCFQRTILINESDEDQYPATDSPLFVRKAKPVITKTYNQLHSRYEKDNSKSRTVSYSSRSSSSSNLSATFTMENQKTHVKLEASESRNDSPLNIEAPSTGNVCADSDPKPDAFQNFTAQEEFLARKQMAMHSRRRFSSHPVDMHGQPLVGFPFTTTLTSKTISSNSPADSHRNSVVRPVLQTNQHLRRYSENLVGMRPLPSQWRQSDTQLVTLPPFPVPLHELKEFLDRYKSALSQNLSTEDSSVPAGRRMSNCESVENAAAQAHDRSRLPSSWSSVLSGNQNPTNADSANSIKNPTSSQRPSLDPSISTVITPQSSSTMLLPTASLIPGSQYFSTRRKHAASASEAVSVTVPPVLPTRQRATSIMEHRMTEMKPSHSGRLSMISLPSSVVPVWADAPVFAKPRTGYNYASREAIIALREQRKPSQRTSNSTQPPSPPAPSSDHVKPSNDWTPSVTNSTSITEHPYHSVIRAYPCYSLLHNGSSNVGTDVSEKQEKSVCSSQCAPCSKATQDDLSRSYVNVGPGTSRRAGLQPIAETQPLLSARTDPIVHIQRRVSNTTDYAAQSVAASSSYVNVCPPVTLSKQAYVNLPSSCNDATNKMAHGLRGIPSSMDEYGLNRKFTPPPDGIASTTSLFTATSNHGDTTTSTPRLHYALLTLSTGQNNHSIPVSPTHVASHASLHNVQSTPCTLDSTETDGATLNYVTIDLAQTKALSELEQELRSGTASSCDTLQPCRSWGFRGNSLRRGGLTLSAMLSGETSKSHEIRARHAETLGGAGGSKQRSAIDITMPIRGVLARLVSSIHHSQLARKSNAIRRQFSLHRASNHALSASSSSSSGSNPPPSHLEV